MQNEDTCARSTVAVFHSRVTDDGLAAAIISCSGLAQRLSNGGKQWPLRYITLGM
jgi:hypothetical protein